MSPTLDAYPQMGRELMPLLSRAGLELAVIAYFLGGFLRIFDISYWAVVGAGMTCGLVLQIAWYGLQLTRFRNHISNDSFVSIVRSACERTGLSVCPEVWGRKSNRQVLAGTASPFFAALVVSDIAVADVLRSPEMGEVVVAEELLNLKKTIAGALPRFVGLVVLSGVAAVFDPIEYVDLLFNPPSYETMSSLASTALMGVMALFLFVYMMYSTRSSGPVDTKTIEIYRADPSIARIGVFGGHSISREKMEQIVLAHPSFKAEQRRESRSVVRKSVAAGTVLGLAVTVIITAPAIPRYGFDLTAVGFMAVAGIAFSFMFSFFVFALFGLKSAWPVERLKAEREMHETFTEDELTLSLRAELARAHDYGEMVVVAACDADEGRGPLVVFERRPLVPSNAVLPVTRAVLDALGDPSLIAAFIYSSVRLGKNLKRANRAAMIVFPVYLVAIFGALFGPVLLGGSLFDDSFSTRLVGILALVLIPSFVLAVLQEREEKRIDRETCRLFPNWPTGLEKLKDLHFVAGYGHPNISKRLRRLGMQ